MVRPARHPYCVRMPILTLAFASLGMAMNYQPLPYCTDQAKVDSIHTLVYIDEAMIPENAPYLGYKKFTYFARTCFQRQFIQKPYYMDTVISAGYTLSADQRRLDMKWQSGGHPDSLPWGAAWYSVEGKVDSTLFYSYRSEPEGAMLVSQKELHLRTMQYETIKEYFRMGADPWTLYSSDSIVNDGGVTTVHSFEDGERYLTRCAQEGATYACTPTPVGEVSWSLDKQVWYLTGGRIDSLRTFDDQGRHRSTDILFWSPHPPVAIRRVPPAGSRDVTVRGRSFNLKGQDLSASRSGSRPHHVYYLSGP